MRNSVNYKLWGGILFTGVLLYLYFTQVVPNHLLHREQIHLFLYTSESTASYFLKPALLANWLGDFLTQFFYRIEVAALILCLLLTLLLLLLYRLLRPYLYDAAIIPALLAIIWEVGRQSSLAYPLASTVSLLGGVAIALKSGYLRTAFPTTKGYLGGGVIILVLSYYLVGYGAWIVLVSLFNWRHKSSWSLLLIAWFALVGVSSIQNNYSWQEACTYPATTFFALPNKDREQALKADIAYTARPFQTAEELPVSNLLSAYYANLKDAQQGRLPYRLMERWQYGVQGLFLPVEPTSNYYTIYAANEVWYALGDMTMTEHAAILGMIFSPHYKGSRALKRLAEVNLINQDEEAALKYLRILENTTTYKQWARERRIDTRSAEVKKWLQEKQQYIPKRDALRTTKDIERSLCELLHANPDNQMALHYLLCYYLLRKEINSFVTCYKEVVASKEVPQLYAEALLIYLASNKASKEEVESFNIPIAIIQRFNAYNQRYQQHQGDGNFLKESFKDTYWFYFHYAQQKDEL